MNWKNNRYIYMIALFVSFSIVCFGQDEIKKEVNNIKRNSEYIWGEASGDDEEMSYELAHDKFISKLKAYIESNPELRNAEAVILPKIEQNEQKLVFNRTLEITVVCVYIKKEDLVPLYRQNAKEEEMAILAPNALKTETLKADTLSVVTNQQPMHGVQMLANKDIVMEQEDETQENIPIVNEQPKALVASSLGTKTSLILADLVAQGNYYKNIAYLETRKDEEHDIMYKGTKSFTNNDGYWLIYDKNKNLIAILDKSKQKDLISNVKVSSNDYGKSPKVWLYIYE